MADKLLTPAHERYHETLGLLASREGFIYESTTKNASAAMRAELGYKPRDWTNLLRILQSRHHIYTVRVGSNLRYFSRIGLSVRNVMQSAEPYVTEDIRELILVNPSFSDSYLEY